MIAVRCVGNETTIINKIEKARDYTIDVDGMLHLKDSRGVTIKSYNSKVWLDVEVV